MTGSGRAGGAEVTSLAPITMQMRCWRESGMRTHEALTCRVSAAAP